jgi:hypothetical protein
MSSQKEIERPVLGRVGEYRINRPSQQFKKKKVDSLLFNNAFSVTRLYRVIRIRSMLLRASSNYFLKPH